MAPPKASGVQTRAAAGKAKENTSITKLQQHMAADLSDEKARSANSQASIEPAPDGGNVQASQHSVQTQSKPEYDPPEGSTSKDEPQDTDMSDLSDVGSEGHTSSSPEPGSELESSDSSSSSISGDDMDLIVPLESLSISQKKFGVVDGFGGKGRSRFFIIKEGPSNAPRYRFERTNFYSTDDFINLSNRISQLFYHNSEGDKCWQYTRANIRGLSGVAIDERDETKGYVLGPHTWVKIGWKGIEPEHRYILNKLSKDDHPDKRHSSWISKSDLARMIGNKAAEIAILGMWDKQETRYLNNKYGKDNTVSRSPTPCPLTVFAANKTERERSRSTSVAPKRLSRSQTANLSLGGSPESLESGSPTPCPGTPGFGRQSPARNNSSVERKKTASRDAPNGLDSARTDHIKEESDDNELFVPNRKDSTLAKDNENRDISKLTPDLSHVRFNKKSYLREKERVENWDSLGDKEKEKRRTIALANWVVYRKEMRRFKAKQVSEDIEVDEDE